ncbi:hypothetical protein [Neolewinella persica]|uniref:hypothetical protein n=1 Tax=Neolewinella persica TaxID=70998 RepID=UPI001B7FC36E|nr:hypothetical protein [Neolewinella persica]
MPEAERLHFAARLAEDEALSDELLALKMARESIHRQSANEPEVEELRAVMRNARKGLQKQRPIVKRLWFRIASGIAAAIILVLVYIGWPINGSLYEQYAEHPHLEMTARGSQDNVTIQEMEEAFGEENYAASAQLLETYATTNGWNSELRLFAGISQLELNNLTSAQAQFEILYAGETANKWAGGWYLALTYLRKAEAGDKAAYQQSEEVLREIPSGSDYHEQAGKLLEEIRGMTEE